MRHPAIHRVRRVAADVTKKTSFLVTSSMT
jgi:hypothetical protein